MTEQAFNQLVQRDIDAKMKKADAKNELHICSVCNWIGTQDEKANATVPNSTVKFKVCPVCTFDEFEKDIENEVETSNEFHTINETAPAIERVKQADRVNANNY